MHGFRLSAPGLFLPGYVCAALVWALTLGAPAALAARGSMDCESWPGEPDPLPTVRDADPERAQWATLRVEGLVDEAVSAESRSLAEADRFWGHVLCLDPDQPQAAQALRFAGPASEFAEPEPVSELRSEFETEADLATDPPAPSPPPVAAPPVSGPDPLPLPKAPAVSEEPLEAPEDMDVTTTPAEATPVEDRSSVDREATPAERSIAGSAPDLEIVNRELQEVEALVRQAHFRTALSVASSTRGLIDAQDPHPALEARRAQLDLWSATSLVALGRDDEARALLASALRSDPNLELDASTTSPKVLRLIEDLRSAPRSTPWDQDGSVALDVQPADVATP